ncbi:MAG: hypothetical protein CUN55_00600 [Phototrophicales bacterium]|nr:MAG: hypothetical protein CUN55_00600 [Phototrophicales bacterium]
MKRDRAFLIFSPEASGNRMLINLLVAAGCKGATGYKQPFHQDFDKEIPQAGDGDIVWLRSVPHAGEMPDIKLMVYLVRNKGYEPVVLMPIRAWWIHKQSHFLSGRAGSIDDADNRIRNAWRFIMREVSTILPRLEFYFISYDEMCRNPEKAIPSILSMLGLNSVGFDFIDGNSKYYERQSNGRQNERRQLV